MFFGCQKNIKDINKLSWALMSSLIVAVFFIIFDRFFKFLALSGFFDKSKELIYDFFKLNFASNYNIAFSLPFNGFWLNVIIVLIIFALIYNLLYLLKKGGYMQASCLVFIIFGAISNLFDRLKYGYVIDYFDLEYFTVFNLADVMIVMGVIGLAWLIIRTDKQYN